MADGLLADKTLLVTGAGRSLGAVIAEACVGEGATVVATDITGDDDGPVRPTTTSPTPTTGPASSTTPSPRTVDSTGS